MKIVGILAIIFAVSKFVLAFTYRNMEVISQINMDSIKMTLGLLIIDGLLELICGLYLAW